MYNEMIQNFRTRTAAAKGNRGDLYLADGRAKSAGVVRVLLGFSPELGTPKVAEVLDFVRKEFGDGVVTSARTFRVHDADGALALTLAKKATTIPLAKAAEAKLHAVVAGVAYSGAQGESWDVIEGAEGPLLVRREAEDVADLVQERLRRQEVTAGAHFANLKSAGRPALEAGDEVEVIVEGKLIKAKFVAFQNGQLKLLTAEDKPAGAGLGALTQWFKSSGEDSGMAAYFNEFYPSESGLAAYMVGPQKGPSKQTMDIPGPLEVPPQWKIGQAQAPRTAAVKTDTDAEKRLALASLLRL